MNRRSFLRLAGAAAAGFALDPEQLLWRPGVRTFFLPPQRSIVTATTRMGRGDLFTIAGQFLRHPVSGVEVPYLQHFVVTDVVEAGDPDPALAVGAWAPRI